ncbi:MAG TPA: DUF2752 domain-containing protein [Elusimicrobiota bacterium]|nr:DUF2752 domain-containing protein [Elusimicrobiota bacterium]
MSKTVPFPAVASAAYAGVLLQAYHPVLPESAGLCPFRLATGIPCPGCGMGHALVFALRGDLAGSFHSHPLGIPLLVLWTAWLGWGALNLSRGRGFSDGFLPALRRPAASWAMLALVLMIYAARFA